jgi:hypothetical protein
VAPERVLNKAEADTIFGFVRPDWERYVRQPRPPTGWTLRLLPVDTGTGFARFNQSTGFTASVQPLYTDDASLPGTVVVGSYYRVGFMRITDEVIKKIEQDA